MTKPIRRKQNRRKLRKCDNFKRGKCAECDDITAEQVGCEMKSPSKKLDEENK